MASGSWFLSRSGLELDLLNPTAESIHWPDVAESLAKTCRFGGHCKGFYSVAEHSVRVADLMAPSDLFIYGLLHDAAESWTGDVIHPLKHILEPIFLPIEEAIDAAVYTAAGIPAPTPQIVRIVKHYDLVMLATERRDLVEKPIRPWRVLDGIEPDKIEIEPYASWVVARDTWLNALLWAMGTRRRTEAVWV